MLAKLLPNATERGHSSSLQIIVVPAIGLAHPSEWVDLTGSWLQRLLEEVVPEADIWEYKYGADVQQGSFSQNVPGEGTRLLEALHDHSGKKEYRELPLILIAHGTGGFVVKKAIRLSSDGQHAEPIMDVIFGVIFLGVPHFPKATNDTEQARGTLDQLLRCQYKGIKRTLSTVPDIKKMMEICHDFELVQPPNPRFQVISAYESRETSTRQKMFSRLLGKGNNPVITPRELCEIGLGGDHEKIVDGEADHFDICKVRIGGPVYKKIVALMEEVTRTAPGIISDRFSRYMPPAALDAGTLATESTADMDELRSMTQFLELSSQSATLPVSSPLGATGGSTTGDFEIIPSLEPLEMSSRNPTLPCQFFGPHQRIEPFFGRDDTLKQIDDYLLPPVDPTVAQEAEQDPEQLRSFAICGLGGMGKTALALEYAWTRREHFEAIFWLTADKDEILAAEFARIAYRLGLEDESGDIAASCGVVHGWLTNPMRNTAEPDSPENKVNWLIIFDNVDNADVLPDYWPKTGRGSVLVTSRDPWARHNDFIQNGVDLPPLSTTESAAMMQRLTHVSAGGSQQGALLAIAERLGGLPLAINQMSGVFRQRKLTYTLLLRFYNEEGIECLQEGSQGSSSDSHNVHSLATLWALDRLSPQTRALLEVVCLLDPDNIPEELLTVEDPGKMELEEYPKTLNQYLNARKELISSSLITSNEESGKISLHRLIQETAKRRMSKDHLIKALRTALRLLVSVWPFQSMVEHHFTARFGKCELLFPSLLRLKDGIEPLIRGPSAWCPDIQVAHLLNDAGWYMFERGLIEELKPFCSLALVVGERSEDSSDEEISRAIRDSHSYLGIATAETNEHQLSMYHKRKWLDMLLEREVAPGIPLEDYELGYAYNEIGVAYANNHLLDEAAEAFQRSIEIFHSLPEFEETMLGWPEPNLGFIYWLQGKYEDAEKALVEILDIHASAWGVDDTKSFKTGKILYAMGNVLEAQGRLNESFNFHTRCLEQYKVTLGVNHHRMGDVCHRMARHFMRQGLYKEADEYINKALKTFSSRPYLKNELARTMFLRGNLLRALGDERQAQRTLMQACGYRKKLLPHDIRKLHELGEKDFDLLVAFWSR